MAQGCGKRNDNVTRAPIPHASVITVNVDHSYGVDANHHDGLPNELADLPASAECVYLHLKDVGDVLTQSEIVNRSP